MAIRISADQARRLALTLQGLNDPPRRKLSADGLLALIERLGFVQVDSVNVVARAHHMILFARNQTYRPALLQRLLEREARLFENWTHDAAIIPTPFYPYWQVRFEPLPPLVRRASRRWPDPGDARPHPAKRRGHGARLHQPRAPERRLLGLAPGQSGAGIPVAHR
jgi:uncharacterized protein YcaQ